MLTTYKMYSAGWVLLPSCAVRCWVSWGRCFSAPLFDVFFCLTFSCIFAILYGLASIAQSVEQLIRNQQVVCSSHITSSKMSRRMSEGICPGFFCVCTDAIFKRLCLPLSTPIDFPLCLTYCILQAAMTQAAMTLTIILQFPPLCGCCWRAEIQTCSP